MLRVNYTDPLLGGLFEDTAVAKVPQRVDLIKLDQNHLTYSYSDTIDLYGEGYAGADAFWTLNNTPIGWKELYDDGTPPDITPLDGEFHSAWTIDTELHVEEDIIVRVDDPFLGPLYYPQFTMEINTSLPKIPENLSAEPLLEGNGIILKWRRTFEANISHYVVFMNNTDAIDYQMSSWIPVQTTVSHINTSTVKGLVDDIDYHFRIASVDDDSIRSSLSLITTGTPHDSLAPTISPSDPPFTLAGNSTIIFYADGDLEYIEMEYYNDIKAHLDDEHGLYRTEISINTEGGMYPAIGTYQENITFYWGSSGGFVWLVLVTWTGKYASRREYGEILYVETAPSRDNGTEEVVFQYVSSQGWDGNDSEYSWWYAGGELIQSSASTVYPDEVVEFTPEDPGTYGYVYTPEELLDLFYMIH